VPTSIAEKVPIEAERIQGTNEEMTSPVIIIIALALGIEDSNSERKQPTKPLEYFSLITLPIILSDNRTSIHNNSIELSKTTMWVLNVSRSMDNLLNSILQGSNIIIMLLVSRTIMTFFVSRSHYRIATQTSFQIRQIMKINKYSKNIFRRISSNNNRIRETNKSGAACSPGFR